MALFHSLFTVVLLVVFIGIVWWAFGPRRKSYFDEAARLALTDLDKPGKKGERS